MVRISLIAAMAENRVIGRDNAMPWHLPGDLKYFKEKTLGKPVVMGRKTFQSIGRPLPGRPNIVMTRDTSFAPDGVIVAHDPEMAFDVATNLAEATGIDEVMVIGGAEIYALALPLADRLYLTRVAAAPEGDARFPELDAAEWVERSRQDCRAGEKDSCDYSFLVLDRI